MFKTVHVQYIQLADNEWSASGIMEKVAAEWLNANKALVKDDDTIACYVYEHGGWYLLYTFAKDGKLMTVGSANDQAQYYDEKKAWREKAYSAKWEQVTPAIRR